MTFLCSAEQQRQGWGSRWTDSLSGVVHRDTPGFH